MGMPLDVLVFLRACDQKPSQDNVVLYGNLITEEYKEFIEAINNNDDPEALDACMDMIWVILGFCQDRKSTRLNSSHIPLSRMPSSA